MPGERLVVDAVPVNDELGLLRMRFDYLAPHVDRFVVAESRRTFTGSPKPLHVSDNLALFEDVADRLTIVVYDAPANASAWEREQESRDAIRRELETMAEDAVALLGDVDEFPSVSQLERVGELDALTVLPLETFYRRANWRLECDTPFLKFVAAPIRKVPADLHELRLHQVDNELSGPYGAHLSFMGFTADQLAAKLQAFSHTEFQFAAPAAHQVLAVADRLVLDHFGRSDLRGRGVLTFVGEADEGEVHSWLRPRQPNWFGAPPRASRTWREMSAAVIHEAMTSQDAELLNDLGAMTTLRHQAARRALVRRARGLAKRMMRYAGRV